MVVLFATKIPYDMMISRGVEDIRAVCWQQENSTHDGRWVVSLCPVLFVDYWYPLVCGILLTVFTYAAHASGTRMFWFQTDQNQNDVKFTLMWWSQSR